MWGDFGAKDCIHIIDIINADGAVGYHSGMHHIFEVFLWRVSHHAQCTPRFIIAVMLFLLESLPSLQNSVYEYDLEVGGVVEIYPQWALSEQDLYLGPVSETP